MSTITATVQAFQPCGQLQPGDPAFGAGFQGGDLFAGEVQAHDAVDEFGGFVWAEAQVDSAQLAQLVAGAQARLRVFARGEHQVHLRWVPAPIFY